MTQRRNVIGIRIALGTKATDLFAMVLREGMRFTVAGRDEWFDIYLCRGLEFDLAAEWPGMKLFD